MDDNERFRGQLRDCFKTGRTNNMDDTEREMQDEARRTELVLTAFREDSTLTVQKLAFAIDRRPSWVRKTLRRAGLVPLEAFAAK
jgi:hypothetical protein